MSPACTFELGHLVADAIVGGVISGATFCLFVGAIYLIFVRKSKA